MKLSKLKNKKIAIWGFGVEGQASAEYLSKHGFEFTVLCSHSEAVNHLDCMTDEVSAEILNGFDVVVKSPGISAYTDIIQQCFLDIFHSHKDQESQNHR